ncbi:MAG: DUF6512 family protein [Bacteroidales bacterium]|nr:DUF6512 family protein [Bacteroidales bacterium]
MSRKETILTTILLVLIGASMHFVHHVPFFNHFLGYVFPVKESVMAHMKMVFYPMLLLSLWLCVTRRDIREIGAPVLAGITVMPLIVIAFFSYWVFVRHEVMAVDLIIYLLAMVGAVLLTRKLRNVRFVRERWPLWCVLIILIIILTGLLTYHAPDWVIFADMG